jgi:hypothetical protein
MTKCQKIWMVNFEQWEEGINRQMKIILNIAKASALVSALLMASSCGTANVFDCKDGRAKSKCTKRTKDEDARIALDNGDMETAVRLLQELVDAEPEEYKRYPLLAAAYAGKSGFSILSAMTPGAVSDDIAKSMTSLLPTPATKGDGYDDSVKDMMKGRDTLVNIPEALRASTSSDKYALSASLQLTLYQAAYAIMLLNKYTYSTTEYDPSKLSSMTAEDAEKILDALKAAGGDSATKATAAIDAQPGATTQEKLAAWSAAHPR